MHDIVNYITRIFPDPTCIKIEWNKHFSCGTFSFINRTEIVRKLLFYYRGQSKRIGTLFSNSSFRLFRNRISWLEFVGIRYRLSIHTEMCIIPDMIRTTVVFHFSVDVGGWHVCILYRVWIVPSFPFLSFCHLGTIPRG